MYTSNVLMAFFFLSGYLYTKDNNTFSIIRKLKSIFKTIVLPYFIFTFLLSFPKNIIYNNDISLLSIVSKILLGNASWFVTALITAEIIYSIILKFSVHKKWVMSIIVTMLFIIAILLTGNEISIHSNIWNFHNALIGLLFLYIGYLYKLYEDKFNIINNTLYISFLIITLVITKIIIYKNDIVLTVEPVIINNYLIFVVDTFISLLLMTSIFKILPNNKILEFIGKRTLVCYFFCGAVPLLTSIIINKIGFEYENNYARVIIAFTIVCIITSGIAWFVYKFLPFTLGKKITNSTPASSQ